MLIWNIQSPVTPVKCTKSAHRGTGTIYDSCRFDIGRFRAEPTGLRKVSTSEWQTYLHIAVPTIDRFHMTLRRPYLCKKQWIGSHVCVQKNPVRIELFSHVKTFFYSKQFAKLLTTWLETIYKLFTIRVIHKLKNLWYRGYDHRRLEKISCHCAHCCHPHSFSSLRSVSLYACPFKVSCLVSEMVLSTTFRVDISCVDRIFFVHVKNKTTVYK